MPNNPPRPWMIYRLEDESGTVFYVGATRDAARRLREHKKVLGYRPCMITLESGSGSFNEAERRWIAQYRAMGAALTNKTDGGNGCWTHSDETRRRLSMNGRGRAKPAGFGATLSAITKGRKHNWSPEGAAAAKRTQFKPGHRDSPHALRAKAENGRAMWANIPPEERSRLAAERNKQAWARRSPEERAEIVRKIADARRRSGKVTSEQLADAARKGWAAKSPEQRQASVAAMNAGRRRQREVAR